MKTKKGFVCGLDIGTSKLCLTCATVDSSGKMNILASQMFPSQGKASGRITNACALTTCIKEACKRLRKNYGLKVRRVYANLDSLDLKTRADEEILPFEQNTKTVNSRIAQRIRAFVADNVSLERKVIHTDFKHYVSRENIDAANQKEQKATRLKVAVVSALVPTLKAFNKCIQDAGLTLEGLIPSNYAQAFGLLRNFNTNPEKNYILLDFGAALTKIAFFEEGIIKDMVILPLGAQQVSEDIAAKLKVSFACAEQLKVKYGRLIHQEGVSNQKVIVKDNLKSRIIQLAELDEIIKLKVESMLQDINKALLELTADMEKVTHISVTGGGSILEGFLEKVETTLGKPVQIGFVYAVRDSRIQEQSALYATSVGLIRYGLSNRAKLSKSFSRLVDLPFAGLAKQARQLYREYF